ncbi:hypothetical protein LCGC14_0767000 [marine sediment metagenome]|uniref:Uncharacterized protein n=1 Tax=marine sediment metagenome TaxID=412755 RepID=A0A0F9SJG2_9ZZZZ
MIDNIVARLIGLTAPCVIELSYEYYNFTICPFDSPRINALWSDIYAARYNFTRVDQFPNLSFERGYDCQSYIICDLDSDELPDDTEYLEFFMKIIEPVLLYFQFLFAGRFYIDRIIWFKPQGLDLIPSKIILYPPQDLLIAGVPLLLETFANREEPVLVRGIEKYFEEFYRSTQNYPFYSNFIKEFLNACVTINPKFRLGYMWNCLEHMVFTFMYHESEAYVLQDELYQQLIKKLCDKLMIELKREDLALGGLQTDQIVSAIINKLHKIRKKAKDIPKSIFKGINKELRKTIEDFPKEPPALTKRQAIDHLISNFNNFPSIKYQIEKTFEYFSTIREEIDLNCEDDFLFTWDYDMILKKPGSKLEGYELKVSKIIEKVRNFRNRLFHRGQVLEDDFEIKELFRVLKVLSIQLLLNLLRWIKPFTITERGLNWRSLDTPWKNIDDAISKMMHYSMRVENRPIVETRLLLEEVDKKIFIKKGEKFQKTRENDYLLRLPAHKGALPEYKRESTICLKSDFEGIVRTFEERLTFYRTHLKWLSEIIQLEDIHEEDTKWEISLNLYSTGIFESGVFKTFKTDKITLNRVY